MPRRLSVPLIPGLLAAALLGVSVAEARTCSSLGAELASLKGGGRSASRAATYDRALREQSGVLARAQSQARAAGCFGNGFLFGRNKRSPVCGSLLPKIERMRSNLANLERLRARHGGSGGGASRARQIRALMARKGCGRETVEARAGRAEKMRSAALRTEERTERDEPEASGEVVALGSTYRTLCVRTCDGYYFPVSFSTSRDRFVDDTNVCQALCPGADTQLYYHSDPGGTGGSGELVSVTGEPYSALPTAYRFRTSFDKSCTCSGTGREHYTVLGTPIPAPRDDGEPAGEAEGARSAPLPLPRNDFGEDPETLANRAGGFIPRRVTGANAAIAATGRSGRPVRVVGPAYWGAQSKEGVLQAPVRN